MPDLALPPLSLYIHIPWCVKKCPYCDFNSHELRPDNRDQNNYIQHLIADLEQDLHFAQNRKLASIFIGGGTPSLFAPTFYEKLLSEIKSKISFNDDIEITIEANPGTLDNNHLYGYKVAGINRLSLGIQSFNDKHLHKLGRIHNQEQIFSAIKKAKEAGFYNINFDLMHGLPEQTREQALNDLQMAIDLAPTHISWYQLTIEPNTAFYSSPPTLPQENILEDISTAGFELLNNNDFAQYEVSAFAKDVQGRFLSKHNLNYWKFGDYLGIGAGAHGKITNIKEQVIIRTQKTRAPKDYLNEDKNYTCSRNIVLQEDLPLEFFMNTLRLNQGFSLQEFEASTGATFSTIKPKLEELIQQKLIEKTNADDVHYRTTALGQQYLNDVLNALN